MENKSKLAVLSIMVDENKVLIDDGMWRWSAVDSRMNEFESAVKAVETSVADVT